MSGCIRVSRTGVRNDGTVQNPHQQYAQIIKVYTDWANHYLDKAKSKRNIKDLQQDLADGVLLSDLVETICNHRLPDVNRKPRTHLQMLSNIKSCLDLLETLGVTLDGITAHDVKEGNLKAILGLFFALSKYKQKQKQQQKADQSTGKSRIPTDMKQQQQQHQHQHQQQSRLPGPTLHSGNITSIPTPFAQRFHHLQNTPAAVNSPYTGVKCASNSSSRSTSPHTFIPSPKTVIKTPVAYPKNINQKNGISIKTNIASPYSSAQKNSILLEKLKASSNQKEKSNKQVLANTKRTSSSSGFSSARSERSDSSNSLSNEPKTLPNVEKVENSTDISKPVLRKKIARPPVSAESRLSKISTKSTSPPKSENAQRKSGEILNPNKEEINCSSTMETSQTQSVRLSGTGIPKPVATVKAMAKPTHTVAPMQQINPELKKVDDLEEKNSEKLPEIHIDHKKSENISHLAPNEIKHDKQNSFTEEDDPALNVKPMEPLLRGYKRSIIVPQHRTIPSDLGLAQNSSVNNNFQEKRISADSDYGHQSSGYVSDGDVLQYDIQSRQTLATDPGYMSEGPTYNDSKSNRFQSSALNCKLNNILQNTTTNHVNLKQRIGSVDTLDTKTKDPIVTLGNQQKIKLNRFNVGPDGGSSSLGPDVSPPTSPPEPTPVAPVYKVIARNHVKKADSGQQTELNSSSSRQSSQWKKYIEAGKTAEQMRSSELERVRDKQSPRRTEKKRSIDGSREDLHNVDYMERKSRSDRAKGGRNVPQSFGYVKRSTSSSNGGKGDSRTAQVSAVPRTKVKVSGGTQTDMKSYSVSGPSATQLSQSVRERLMANQSDQEPKMSSPYGTWVRRSPVPPHYTASLPSRTGAIGGMIEAESIESLPAQLHHRASLTHSRLMTSASPNTSPSPSQANRISRSNSIRSTKSEKMYPSMLQRTDEPDSYYSIPYTSSNRSEHRTFPHASQPTSPTPTGRYNYQSPQPNHRSILSSPYAASIMSKINGKDDDAHGSALSLISTGSSSLYSGIGADEKQAHEVRRLRRDLSDAQDKVHTLTSQLSTNAHVVSAFEQSLSNMTQRLQQLTATAEKKDHELRELRQTIEVLRKQNAESGNFTGNQTNVNGHQRRHTINSAAADSSTGNNIISRQLSTDSVSSLNSLSSACSASSSAQQSEADKKKKRGWLRSSFNKAFSRSKKNRSNSLSDAEEAQIARAHQNAFLSDLSAPSSPLLNAGHMNGLSLKNGHSSTTSLYDCDRNEHDSSPEMVDQLKKQLREKDLVLTDIRLEALSSAHQLESLKDTVIKMRDEMLNLKQDNERLQKIVTDQSLQSSCSSLLSPPMSSSHTPGDESTEALLKSLDSDAALVQVKVFLGSHGSFNKYNENKEKTCTISALPVSPKTKWDMVDHLVVKGFKDYVERIDPLTKLGLCGDSIWSYHVDDLVRYVSNGTDNKAVSSNKSPYECLTNGSHISICLKGAMHSGSLDALAFSTLIPKTILQRYVSLLSEHHRIILCGPSGTGKSYLSSKLGEFLAMKTGKECNSSSVVTFSVDDNTNKDLQRYLSGISDQADCDASQVPSVVILDNLHKALSLPDVFNGFHSPKCPYIIGTINQSTCSTTSLQLHHNFRWVLCANHMEPMKGFLGRCLRRKLVEHECQLGQRNAQLKRVVDWIPEVRNHLNQLIETHNSSEVTLGPGLFISCPMDPESSQTWFTDLWNYSLVPYVMDVVREGIKLYGKRSAWKDPTSFVVQSYPWSNVVRKTLESFIRIRPEDVGYDMEQDHDPLLNMLMTLQEAANYSSPQNDKEMSLPIGGGNGTLATL
ncbi:protein sickie isoform X2 [Adelges cooleyi]|uniref:protein sickie isoform X2 n=1 Tax=Adelges cooleyi TaxID=133065 RepID=UPI002180595B|nr:protein sickie isoform X2 [Adelges cooleyi]